MQRPIRLMTVAPGHFHAALVQKRMVPGIHPRSHIYAPLDDDLLDHLGRIADFNHRKLEPTAWELDIRTGQDFQSRMLREQPGNTVVLAGRNRDKIDLILAAVRQGLNVLADKPWVIEPDDFPKLEEALREAEIRDVFTRDMMTERFEVPIRLLRELMCEPEVFGDTQTGSPSEPGLSLESIHSLRKTVAGRMLRRPVWWFDVSVAGQALADVGTHLADLAMWLLFPEQAIDFRRDIQILESAIWPTPLGPEQLEAITGRADAPMMPAGDRFLYQGNGSVTYQLGGIVVGLTTLWDFESAEGTGDTYEIIARGTVSTISIRFVAGQPELSLVGVTPAAHEAVYSAVVRQCESWQVSYPGVMAEDRSKEIRIVIPQAVRTSHEDHFAEVVSEFVRHYNNPRQIPEWERPNLLAKYFVTTQAVELARK